MKKSCPVLLEYLPWAGLDKRQIAVIEKGNLDPFYLRSLRRGRGSMEECFQSVPQAKRRWRFLRRHRVAERMAIFKGSRSNMVTAWDADTRRRRRLR